MIVMKVLLLYIKIHNSWVILLSEDINKLLKRGGRIMSKENTKVDEQKNGKW